MTTENDPESQPDFSPVEETNPFAPPEISYPDSDSTTPNQTSESTEQLPPIQPSYIFAAGLSILFCLVSISLSPDTAVIALLGLVATPFAIARLVIHRKNITRAIMKRSFPGNVQFNGLYYLSSLAIACFAVFAGVLVFFGICLFVVYNDAAGFNEQGVIAIVVIDAVLAFFTASFLIRLATPKYE